VTAHEAAAPGSVVVAEVARALSDAVTAASTSLKLLQTELMEVLVVAAGKRSSLDHHPEVEVATVSGLSLCVVGVLRALAPLPLRTQRPAGHCVLDCAIPLLRTRLKRPTSTSTPTPTAAVAAAAAAEEVDAGGAAVRTLLLDALRNDGAVPLCSRLLPKLARLLVPQESVVIRRMRAAIIPQPGTTSSATCVDHPTQLPLETSTLHAAVVAFASRSIEPVATDVAGTGMSGRRTEGERKFGYAWTHLPLIAMSRPLIPQESRLDSNSAFHASPGWNVGFVYSDREQSRADAKDEGNEDAFAVSAAVELIDTLRVHSAGALLEPLFTRALHLNAVHVAEAIVRVVAGGSSLHEGDETIQAGDEPAAEAAAEGTCTARVLLQRLLEHCEATGGVRAAKKVAAKLASDVRFATGGLGLAELALPVNIITRGARPSERISREEHERDAELPLVRLPAERVVLVHSVEGVEAARGCMETAAAQVRLCELR